MKKDFSKFITTINGTPVAQVRYNSAVNLWLGMVKDPMSSFPDKWITISWKPSGKCINANRPELNLL